MVAPWWFWIAFNLAVLVLLLVDLGLLARGARAIPVREALARSGFFFVLGLGFCLGVWAWYGDTPGARAEHALAFLTGFLIEWSLSVDNIFVFVLVFAHFQVPPTLQHRVLFWGILGALAMRLALILAGGALIQAAQWVMLVFGLFLMASGWRMLRAVDETPDFAANRVLAFVRRRWRVTEDYEGNRFFVRREGVRYMTPLFLVLVLVELSDLVFALDSIPAIFAVTSDPFIVYTANVFAILGLRAMYFALAGVVHRFHYLKYGLSLVLILVGAKMIANYVWKTQGWGEKALPAEAALVVTTLLIGGSILLSLWRTRAEAPAARAAHTGKGWVPLTPPREPEREQPRP